MYVGIQRCVSVLKQVSNTSQIGEQYRQPYNCSPIRRQLLNGPLLDGSQATQYLSYQASLASQSLPIPTKQGTVVQCQVVVCPGQGGRNSPCITLDSYVPMTHLGLVQAESIACMYTIPDRDLRFPLQFYYGIKGTYNRLGNNFPFHDFLNICSYFISLVGRVDIGRMEHNHLPITSWPINQYKFGPMNELLRAE